MCLYLCYCIKITLIICFFTQNIFSILLFIINTRCRVIKLNLTTFIETISSKNYPMFFSMHGHSILVKS